MGTLALPTKLAQITSDEKDYWEESDVKRETIKEELTTKFLDFSEDSPFLVSLQNEIQSVVNSHVDDLISKLDGKVDEGLIRDTADDYVSETRKKIFSFSRQSKIVKNNSNLPKVPEKARKRKSKDVEVVDI